MANKDDFGSEQHTVRLDRTDVVCMDDGCFVLPVTLDGKGQQIRGHLKLEPDDAARLHAQLDRLLSRGWAMSEETKLARQNGETYPVSGSGHLKSEGLT